MRFSLEPLSWTFQLCVFLAECFMGTCVDEITLPKSQESSPANSLQLKTYITSLAWENRNLNRSRGLKAIIFLLNWRRVEVLFVSSKTGSAICRGWIPPEHSQLPLSHGRGGRWSWSSRHSSEEPADYSHRHFQGSCLCSLLCALEIFLLMLLNTPSTPTA